MRCDAVQMTRGIGGAAGGTSAFDPEGSRSERLTARRCAGRAPVVARAAGEGMTHQPSTQADRDTILRGDHP
jgi:hypothetical protein